MHPTQIFNKADQNPILSAHDWPVPVNAVFNAGACQDGADTVLLCRVEDSYGFSHLWVARSTSGVSGWRIEPEPLLSGSSDQIHQMWGFEDARIVQAEGVANWFVTCTAYGPPGPAVYFFTTDFKTVFEQRVVMEQNKNAAVLPRRINGYWYMLHRPTSGQTKSGTLIEVSKSQDLHAWEPPQLVMSTREGAWWDSVRLGIGPPPIETEHGWLLLYHGARTTVSGAIYRVGAAMLAKDDPSQVTHRTPSWLLTPSEPYERIGDVGNVVFPCGAVHDADADTLRLYYGAADTCMALATGRMSQLVDYVMGCPVE